MSKLFVRDWLELRVEEIVKEREKSGTLNWTQIYFDALYDFMEAAGVTADWPVKKL